MDCQAEPYVWNNDLQRAGCKEVVNTFVKDMVWTCDETVLDVGCGPGDITADLLFRPFRNKIKLLVGVDKSRPMIEYAKRTYGCSGMDFEVVDVQKAYDCASLGPGRFDKIFSFYCFHWLNNGYDALVNMHSMLKSGGEMLVHFPFKDPVFQFYKHLDTEWKTYTDQIIQNRTKNFGSEEEVKDIFTTAGFRVINTDSSVKKHTFDDFSSLLDAYKLVDEMFNFLPPDLCDKYLRHTTDKIPERKSVHICPDTGKSTVKYHPITVHAVKD